MNILITLKTIINKNYAYLDSSIIGCTEISLIYKEIDTELNLIDPLSLQCKEAISFLTKL